MAYVYGHYKADTGELFYIGKGTGDRAWETRRNPHWTNVAKKYGVVVRIIQDNISEEAAFQREKELIAEIGIDNLTNIRPGGEGYTSEESRELQKRLHQNPKYIEKLREGQKRRWKTATPQQREQHRKASIENVTPEGRERKRLFGNRNGMYGKKHSEKVLKALRQPRGLNPKLTGDNNPAKRPEVRLKMSESRKKTPLVTCMCGKTMSPQNYARWHKGNCTQND